MIQDLWQQFRDVLDLGRSASDVGYLAMALRTVIVYLFVVAAIRVGSKRFLSKATPFDVVVAVMLGSMSNAAITGSAPFFSTLVGAVLVLIGMHAVLACLTAHSDRLGPLIKGSPRVLIEDGKVQWDQMRSAGLSKGDLEEVLRLDGKHPEPARIQLAVLERNGDISVVRQAREPRAVQVSVRDGVQTVRIELE